MVEISAKTTLKKRLNRYNSVYGVYEVSKFRDLRLRSAHPFGQGWADKHRDGDDERGELLGVDVIVVCVGIEGGTFVLLYLHWQGPP